MAEPSYEIWTLHDSGNWGRASDPKTDRYIWPEKKMALVIASKIAQEMEGCVEVMVIERRAIFRVNGSGKVKKVTEDDAVDTAEMEAEEPQEPGAMDEN